MIVTPHERATLFLDDISEDVGVSAVCVYVCIYIYVCVCFHTHMLLIFVRCLLAVAIDDTPQKFSLLSKPCPEPTSPF